MRRSTSGISYLLVPMRQPGVDVRRITQPDGTAEFCEVFFTDARCPADNVVGGVNNGWKVANSTLAFERGQSATTGYRRFAEEFDLLVDRRPRTRPCRRRNVPRPPGPLLHRRADPAHERAAHVVGAARRQVRLRHRRLGGDEQAVLVGDAPTHDGAGARHLRCRGAARRHRPGTGFVARPPRAPSADPDIRCRR